MKLPLLVLLGLFAAVVHGFSAELRVAQPFQNHMVLQRQMPVPVWGWSDPGKTITVKLGDKQTTATAKDDGSWRADLPAMEANSNGQSLSITDGTKTITLSDVLVGEVWFCTGQSNMARSVKTEVAENPQVSGTEKDCDYPLVRFINYPNYASDTPLADLDPVVDGKATWQILGPETVNDSFCMGFFFGRDLFKDLQVPVGLVQIAVSGTTQTAWCEKSVLDSVKAAGARTFTYDDCLAAAEKKLADSKEGPKSWAEFKTADAAWHANPTGRWPGSLDVMDFPSVLYNGLVHPLAPMALRGMVWHQGEAGPAMMYGERMVAMVNQWRKLYGQDFWFMFGTMTRFTTHGPPLVVDTESLRSGVNDQYSIAQQGFGKDGKGVMVPFLDLGNTATHWERKTEAGNRLALAAMDLIYGKPSIYSGPQMTEFKIEGATVTCKFSNVGTGLKYVPSIDGISGFVLQGSKNSVWATPKIEGTDTLVFSDPAVPDPLNLFYAYNGNPHETLFNSADMPGYSFRLVYRQPDPRAPKDSLELVTPGAQTDPKTLHVSDVRRYAYVVGFISGHPKPGPNTAKCYIPKEWAKPAAQQNGKDIPLGDLTTDAQGNRFAQISAECNGPPVVLYDASHPEALAAANLQRY